MFRCETVNTTNTRTFARKHLEREQAKIKSRITRIVAAIASIGHSRALIDELAELERRQAEIAAELARAETRPAAVPLLDYDQVRAAVLVASDIEKGQILRGFVKSIHVEKIDGAITGEIVVWLGEVGATVGL